MVASRWRVSFVWRGKDCAEEVPAPTKFWAAAYLRAKYRGAFVYRVVLASVRDWEEVAA